MDQLLKLKRQKAKFYHGRSSRILPEIEIGQDVRVAPLQTNDVWKRGTCIEKLSDRPYVVQTDAENHLARRNRAFLKPAEKPAPLSLSSKPVDLSESQPSRHSSKPATVPEHKPISPAVKRTRARTIKPPARLSDYTTKLLVFQFNLGLGLCRDTCYSKHCFLSFFSFFFFLFCV